MSLSIKRHLLPVSLPVLLLVPLLAAAQQTTAPVPVTPAVGATTAPSAFNTYQTYVDEPVANWMSANDTVGRIGGWRAYAKEAAAAATNPSAPSGPVAKP